MDQFDGINNYLFNTNSGDDMLSENKIIYTTYYEHVDIFKSNDDNSILNNNKVNNFPLNNNNNNNSKEIRKMSSPVLLAKKRKGSACLYK